MRNSGENVKKFMFILEIITYSAVYILYIFIDQRVLNYFILNYLDNKTDYFTGLTSMILWGFSFCGRLVLFHFLQQPTQHQIKTSMKN